MVNNRKVNKGKKHAIEAGRNALKIAHNTGDLGSTMGGDAEIEHDDADGEEDDDYSQSGFRLPSSLSPSVAPANNPRKRARPSYTPKIGSDELVDATHYESAIKKPKRQSNSRYQVNQSGQMVDVRASEMRHAPQIAPQSHVRARSSSVRSQNDATNEYDMTRDHRINTDHIVHGDPTTHQGQGGFPGTGAFGGGSFGGFQGAQFGGAHQRRH